jgi:hypothetical protein
MTTTTSTTMAARFPGKCTSCGGRISVGATILWAKGEGARHADCSASSTLSAPGVVINSRGLAIPREMSAQTPANRRARLAIRAAIRGDNDLRRIGEDDDTAGFHGQDRAGRTYRTM